MPSFGKRSMRHLGTCDDRLVRVCHRAIKVTDFSVLCGRRGREEQNAAYDAGASKVRWPNSRHNPDVSLAVDLAPWPIAWKDTERFYLLAGVMLACAAEEGVELDGGFRWRWDEGHFELKERDDG